MSTTTDLPGELGAGYAQEEDHRPLAGYAAISAIFGVALAGALAGGRELPERPGAADLVLAGVATQKISRLLAKDKVTSFIRAPFTRYEEPGGQGEVEEAPRGSGARYAIGELLVCPYCLSQWIAAAFAVGLIAAPRLTRLLTSMWAAQAIGDAAQLGF